MNMKLLASTLSLLVLASLARAAHECERECVAGDARTCRYTFHLQEYHTMSRACFQCPHNLTDCVRPECVAGDGVARPLVAVNRQLPGPSVQVCEGDRVVVDVYNWLLSDTETIHWHGQHMRDFQYYDGVPFVTQCPILSGSFRYNFLATTTGTHWWHSHSGLHRGSGVFGPFVVREVEDQQALTYDVDSPEHVLVMFDWIHNSVSDKFFGRFHSTGDEFASNILINGKGRIPATKTPLEVVRVTPGVPLQTPLEVVRVTPGVPLQTPLEVVRVTPGVPLQTPLEVVRVTPGVPLQTPLEVVRVTPGLRHRLRLINAGSLNCPIIVSVDNHRLVVIATDGTPILPYTADSVVLYSGERFDVVLTADQPADNYWIRFNGLIDCEQNECMQGAVLRYEGAPEEDPAAILAYDPNYPPGVVVNPLNTAGVPLEEVTMVELTSLVPSTLEEHVDKRFYLGFNFNQIDNLLLYNPDFYSYTGVSEEWQVNTPQLNNISFRFPLSPPLSQPEDPQPTLCRYGEEPPCIGNYCSCTYVLEVALGETVELVLVDEGIIGDENHPFHLHGNNFYVVAVERLGSQTTVEEVMALDAAGGISRKLTNAIKKDTVTIPDGGYTIVRFTADNPGWWLMHCHLVFHSELGMIGVLHVGDSSDLPPLPTGFPTCNSFMPDL